ncbi:uncharacterized protein LOC113851183 [Abrus precatorius]|uniref:Uncharacterized protein LOC113851183 n=1 Tax=Abrus precatorius TaxID=3816 RepID=A0A8B8K175_ABRPR|nr:uncharacterized protein LOC113851183 [Abrus precatorius]
MEQEEVGEDAKWVTHYCSDHQILLVGEGDFSFSLCLAKSFASASNIVATSLNSFDEVTKMYKNAKSNLDDLQNMGACLLHGVDATKMKLHSDLKKQRFDRVIFNFPHADYWKEDDPLIIKMHKDLVLGFFKNASCMLRADGEIHVSHKITAPFSNWNIVKLATQSFLTLIECADFKKEDYLGYDNKRGHGNRCDEPFPLGKCCTFKFIYNPKATRNHTKRNQMVVTKQLKILPLQEIKDAVELLPTSVHNFYPHTSRIPKMNEVVTSIFGLTNRHTSITGGYLSNVGEVYRKTAPSALHGVNLGPQRSLQPMEPLQSLQPWPQSTNVRYSDTDRVRTIDTIPLSLGARNEGYHVCGGSSNYLQEAFGRTTAQTASYSFDGVRPDFGRYIDEIPRRTLNGNIYGGCSNYLNEELDRTAQRESYYFDRVRSDFGSYMDEIPRRTLNGNIYGGSSNYLKEELGRTAQRESYYFDRARSDFGRYIDEIPRRTLNGNINYLKEALGRTAQRESHYFDSVRSDFERYICELPKRTFQSEFHQMSILMPETDHILNEKCTRGILY